MKPLKDLDNGALLELVRDVVQQFYDDADTNSVPEQRAASALEALKVLEARKGFQIIKDEKDSLR